MGPSGNQVASSGSTAVMFVEVQYDYKPLVTDKFLGARTIKSVSAFNVRQRTNQVVSNDSNVTASKCSVFSA
jgi:hypothetical protein